VAERAAAIAGFLESAGWAGAERRPLAGDASFRRYERLALDGRTAMLMDALPPREDVRPFVAMARHLVGLGYSAPRILAEDTDAGLLVIEDLGDATYTSELARGADEEALYTLAVDLLIDLHRNPGAARIDVPPYDDRRLLDEAALLTDWYMPAMRGYETPPAARAAYLDLWRTAFATPRQVPETLVLRDYHVDNLMVVAGREGLAACGLLDFQDAVIGPVSYDLVSLIEDARRDVPASLAHAMVERYLGAFPDLDRAAFAASRAILGAQRSAKIIGIFTRLLERDGKAQYLAHIPRVWRLLEGDLAHPALAPMRAWLDAEIPPGERGVPMGGAMAMGRVS
jgi:aminoglycoside/choline kinase family phosphotransferase